jgi:site-specific DNA-methyltransferase (adenine-specific)
LSPYYADESVTLYHGDCLEVLADMAERSVDCVITDPPYTERTHKNATTNKIGEHDHPLREGGNRSFAAIGDAELKETLSFLGRLTRRWLVSTLDYRHAIDFDNNPPAGLRVLRIGVWVKTNPTPQISGDRPAQGWESIAYMHRNDLRPAWNAGGRHGNFVSPIPRPEGHPTAKPIGMVRDWVRWFTEPADLVLDPFVGSGTTLRAAKDEGRRAVGVELDERYCEIAARRMSQDVLDFDEASA